LTLLQQVTRFHFAWTCRKSIQISVRNVTNWISYVVSRGKLRDGTLDVR